MGFARRVFMVAGIYGIVVLLPQYFLEDRIGRNNPPPITHAENFYGFIGTALAWQLMFLLIARDPVRYRPYVSLGIIGKLLVVVAVFTPWLTGAIGWRVPALAGADLVFAALFADFLRRTR